MKYKYNYFYLFIILITLSSCKQSTEPLNTKFYVNIEVESSFQNNPVQTTVDRKILLDSNITTNDILSLAWGSGLKELTKEDHILKF